MKKTKQEVFLAGDGGPEFQALVQKLLHSLEHAAPGKPPFESLKAVLRAIEAPENRQRSKTDLPFARTKERLLNAALLQDGQDAAVQLYGEQAATDMRFLHVVLAQCGLPYKDPGNLSMYTRKNGRTSLAITPGALFDPISNRFVEQGLPYGPKPRLLLIHLCTEAVRTKSAEINVGDSMSAFMRDLGLAVTGGERGTIRSFKEQMNRLAASRMQFGTLDVEHGKARTMNPAPLISEYEMWFPKSPEQQMLWPSTVTLSDGFFASLMNREAMPLNTYAVKALQGSAMKLDIYTWLAHRLCRIPKHEPVAISWEALKLQLGPEYKSMTKFRQDFREAIKAVQEVYRDANIGETEDGRLELRYSSPPVPRTINAGKAKSTKLL